MGRRRNFAWLPLALTLLGIAAASALYIFGMAWYQSIDANFFDASDLWVPRSIDVLISLWLLWLGASIGSFLNVVAWRMPRGVSINGRSHCPRCETHLKFRDNLPVLGWISLRGRCRTCRLPISPRYPIVEFAVGVSLTLIGFTELYQLAIPGQPDPWTSRPLWTPRIHQPLLIVLVYHATALAMSWVFGLIRYDRSILPWRLVSFAALAMIVPILAFPTLMIVPWQTVRPEDWVPDGLYFDAVMRVVTALAASAVIARSLARGLCPSADPKLDPLGSGTARLMDLVVIVSVPGVVVGWQALPAIITMASLLALVLRAVLKGTDTLGCFALAVPVTLTLQISFWRHLHSASFWPSDQTSHWVILAWAVAILVIPVWLREAPQPVMPVKPVFVDDEDEDEAAAPSEPTDACE